MCGGLDWIGCGLFRNGKRGYSGWQEVEKEIIKKAQTEKGELILGSNVKGTLMKELESQFKERVVFLPKFRARSTRPTSPQPASHTIVLSPELLKPDFIALIPGNKQETLRNRIVIKNNFCFTGQRVYFNAGRAYEMTTGWPSRNRKDKGEMGI